MTLITIRVEPYDGLTGHVERHSPSLVHALVVSNQAQRICTASETLVTNLSVDDYGDIQWYFEEFPLRDPFETRRALAIQKKIWKHGAELLENFVSTDIFQEQHKHCNLLIQIHDTNINSSSHSATFLSKCFWETLENISLWEEAFGYCPAVVYIVRTTQQISPAEIAIRTSQFEIDKASWNVLAITARPSKENDIPHRLITRSISDTLKKFAGEADLKPSLEIVRPGTFAALEHHLKIRPPRYFKAVHLDLHGIIHNDEVQLEFVRFDASMKQYSDPVTTKRLASLLNSVSVETVVINACRSAASLEGLSNIASLLVKAGIKTVIGMSFNVLSVSAEKFMAKFYEVFLGKQASVFQAVSKARQELRKQSTRLSIFGTELEFEDFVVPQIYSAARTISENEVTTLDDISSEHQALGNNKEAAHLFGREGEMLHFESIMSQSNITYYQGLKIHLRGQPGIGKTAFIKHSLYWWLETGLYREAIYVDFSEHKIRDMAVNDLIHHLLSLTNEPPKHMTTKVATSCLNSAALLIILDSLESLRWETAIETDNYQKGFRQLLTRLKKSSVILVSRDEDSWLGSSIQARFFLNPLDFGASSALSADLFRGQGVADMSFVARDDYNQFHHLILLCHGNPLAIKIMVHDLCHRQKESSWSSIADHVTGLLTYRPLYINLEAFEDDQGSRSVKELFTYFKSSDDMLLIASLMAFWHNLLANFEPFVTSLTGITVAKGMLDGNDFRKFCQGLRKWAQLSYKHQVPLYEALSCDDESPFFLCEQTCSSNASLKLHELDRILGQDLQAFVTTPRQQTFGSEKHRFSVLYLELSPILTMVASSHVVRASCPEDFPEILGMAKSFLYSCREEELFESKVKGADALRSELDFDFYNHLGVNLSHHQVGSWPCEDDWLSVNLIAESQFLDGRRLQLLEHVLRSFTKLAIKHITRLRQKYTDPLTEDYKIASQFENDQDWSNCSSLEYSCLTTLISGVNFCHLMLHPIIDYHEIWQILAHNPMCPKYKEMDPDLLEIFLASNRVNTALIQFWSTPSPSSVHEITSGIANLDILGKRIRGLLLPEVEEKVPPKSNYPWFQNLALGSLTSDIESRILQLIPAQGETDRASLAETIIQLGDLLREEVEGSDNRLVRHTLHSLLSTVNQRYGNSDMAFQHASRERDIIATMEPVEFAELMHIKDHGIALFHLSQVLSVTNPEPRLRFLEEQPPDQMKRLRPLSIDQPATNCASCGQPSDIEETLTTLGENGEAVYVYQQMVQDRKKLFPFDNKITFSKMFKYAKLLSDTNRYEESIPVIRIVIDRLKMTKQCGQLYLNAVEMLAIQILKQVKHSGLELHGEERLVALQEAEALFLEALQPREGRQDPVDHGILATKTNLVELYQLQSRFGEAETILQEVVDGRLALARAPYHPTVLQAQSTLADLKQDMDRHEAKELMEIVLYCRNQLLGIRHPDTSRSMVGLHAHFLLTGDLEAATELVRRFSDVYKQSIEEAILAGPDSSFNPDSARYSLALTLQQCEEFEEAGNLLEAVCNVWRRDANHERDLASALHAMCVSFQNLDPPSWDKIFEYKTEELGLKASLDDTLNQQAIENLTTQRIVFQNWRRFADAEKCQHALIAAKSKFGVISDKEEFGCLGTLYLKQRKLELAQEAFQRALAAEECLDPNSGACGLLHDNVGNVYVRLRHFQKATEHKLLAATIFSQIQGKSCVMALSAKANASETLRDQGKYDESIALLDDIVRRMQSMQEDSHPVMMNAKLCLVGTLRDRGDLDLAEAAVSQIIVGLQERRCEDPAVSFCYIHLSIIYGRRRLYERSFAYSEQALKIRKDFKGSHPDSLSLSALRHGSICTLAGKWNAAEETLRNALQSHRDGLGSVLEDEENADLQCALAFCLIGQRNPQKLADSEHFAQEALRISLKIQGEDGPVGSRHLCLAYLRIAQLRHFEALQLIRKVFKDVDPLQNPTDFAQVAAVFLGTSRNTIGLSDEESSQMKIEEAVVCEQMKELVSASTLPPNIFFCKHYKRPFSVCCITCRRWHRCERCHDWLEDHNLAREQVAEMMCLVCGWVQEPQQSCQRCGIQAKNYCDECKVWDDTNEIKHGKDGRCC